MKKYIFLFILNIFGITLVNAQVGINYTPQKGDSINAPLIMKSATQNKTLRYKPSTANVTAGQVLISDVNGNVSYGNLNSTKIDFVNGFYTGGLTIDEIYSENLKVKHTGAYITLPPGVWSVNFNFKLKILKSRVIVNDVTSNLVYRTSQKYTNSEFRSGTTPINVTAVNSGPFYYNSTTFSNLQTSACTGSGTNRRCTYTFNLRQVIPALLSEWEPISRDESIWARVILSDNLNTVYTSNYNSETTKDTAIPGLYLASGTLVGLAEYSNLKGEMYINNKTRSNKTYYVKLILENIDLDPVKLARYKLFDFAAGPNINGIDRFFAVPANDK